MKKGVSTSPVPLAHKPEQSAYPACIKTAALALSAPSKACPSVQLIGKHPGAPVFSFPDESELSFQFGTYSLLSGALALLLISTEPVLFYFLAIAAVGFALLGLLMGLASLFGGVLTKNNDKRKWLMVFGMLFSLLGMGLVALSLILLFS